MALKIGELAHRAEVNLQTIRFCEREGLLPEPPRHRSGYRFYPDDAVRRLRFIKRAQEIRFSLADIRELLSLRVHERGESAAVRALASARIADRKKDAYLEGDEDCFESPNRAMLRLGPNEAVPYSESIDSDEVLR
jgi:DNA-binding transcriptional MerR regulator